MFDRRVDLRAKTPSGLSVEAFSQCVIALRWTWEIKLTLSRRGLYVCVRLIIHVIVVGVSVLSVLDIFL